MIVQTIWGTQVRQQVDVLAETAARENWMDQLQGIFYFHRSMAIALILIGIAYFYFARKQSVHVKTSYYILGVVLTEGIIGKLFSLLSMPAALQPLHLILSMILLSLFYFSILKIKIR